MCGFISVSAFCYTLFIWMCLTCEEPQDRRAEDGEYPVSPDDHVSYNYLCCVFSKCLSISLLYSSAHVVFFAH